MYQLGWLGLPGILQHLNLLHSFTGWIPPDYLMSVPKDPAVYNEVHTVCTV